MSFQIPQNIRNLSKDAKRIYPYAMSLKESIKIYNLVMSKIEENTSFYILLALLHKETQELLVKGIDLRWDYLMNRYDTQRVNYLMECVEAIDDENRHLEFVNGLQKKVNELLEKFYIAHNINNNLEHEVKLLMDCNYTREKLKTSYQNIQKYVDELDFGSFSNLHIWVDTFNTNMRSILLYKLHYAIADWLLEFDTDLFVSYKTKALKSNPKHAEVLNKHSLIEKRSLNIPKIKHEILIKNQTISVKPPLENSQIIFYKSFHDHVSKVCALPRIKSSRFDLELNESTFPNYYGDDSDNSRLLLSLDEDFMLNAYTIINQKINQVETYVQKWLQYQALWDLEHEKVFSLLGDDLQKWQQIILEIKRARSTFDTTESQKSFGHVIVDYENVQSKVNSRYDLWQKDTLKEYSNKLNQEMKSFYTSVNTSRSKLETFSIENNSITKMIDFITFVQDLKNKVPKWEKDVDLFLSGQKTIELQRFSFPENWIYPEQIKAEWSSFSDILNYKNDLILQQIDDLKMKIENQDENLSKRSVDLLEEWEKTKPVKGDIKYDLALKTMTVFESKIQGLTYELNQINKAKKALNLNIYNENRLQVAYEEIKDLKSVWESLSEIWKSLYELYDIPWNIVVPKQIRLKLDSLLKDTKSFNSSIRQYDAFSYLQESIRELLKTNSIVLDLKSESMKDRHWKELFKTLNKLYTPLSDLSLGDVWAFKLTQNEQTIKAIFEKAQGEMALEEFLKQTKETWTSYTLELVNYQNKCRLIKGWDDLLTQVTDNLSSLNSMKMSPYFKIFEDQVNNWDEKLNKIQTLFFDVWIDVQRQWIYLEGIFIDNTDIKHLLPMESSRFQNINLEFLTTMKKVYKSPYILDILNIPNIHKSLERIKELLTKIKKALGEYLEKERSNFPRFYFVGDEDLLEIIGNSKDVSKIQTNFKKMFSGVETVVINKDQNSKSTYIRGIVSKEGEQVSFKNSVEINDTIRIHKWLNAFEKEIKDTLSFLLEESMNSLNEFFNFKEYNHNSFYEWIQKYPDQIVLLAIQIRWTMDVEECIKSSQLEKCSEHTTSVLSSLSQLVLNDLENIMLQKCQHLITEFVHQKDVINDLISLCVTDTNDINWICQLRYYITNSDGLLDKCTIRIANAAFQYGFEYLGVVDKLVQTKLTDKCFLTLTQALCNKLGGSPFGPAGTGKTESVKALGNILGRFVLVFCCDENFDYHSMGRIFIGLCQVGAWGCFDEFNRLEENILSAVSQQIQSIQISLESISNEHSKNNNSFVEIIGKKVKLNKDTGIFITMNPGYSGRSNLPDNLKRLFRSISMTKPDKQKIAQVMLYSQGFVLAEPLSLKIVPLFNLCIEQLSSQRHYDFGLRALKSVLVSAGSIKRNLINKKSTDKNENNEQLILIQSLKETVLPKLVKDDILMFEDLINDIFPQESYNFEMSEQFEKHLRSACKERNLIASDNWIQKVIQLYKLQHINHGIMLVGPSGEGKSSVWNVLLSVIEKLENCDNVHYIIDPKAISKENLYGSLDTTTREWSDGLFTHILRKILDNVRGESFKRHWIVFDGDVDPEWVENLNSVLDDNKLLTLPNGERLNIPHNVRIIFEVESLKYATLATVSRCGMIWFNHNTITLEMLKESYFMKLKGIPITEIDDFDSLGSNDSISNLLELQNKCHDIYYPYFESNSLFEKCLALCKNMLHIMDFTMFRALSSLFAFMNKTVREIYTYDLEHSDFKTNEYNIRQYLEKKFLLSVLWSLGGDLKADDRNLLSKTVCELTTVSLPNFENNETLYDYDVSMDSFDWVSWNSRVPLVEIDTNMVSEPNIIIPTIDTLKHENILYSLLTEHKPMLLCGPPGSGKTMTLLSALRKSDDLDVIGLNFSSATTPKLIIKTFEQYCEFKKSSNEIVMSPSTLGKWLVVFCDEINLPNEDKYGTQRIIYFIRQLIEQGGFWRTKDKMWIRLERIQFVGACNPPTDPGRNKLSNRFLRHMPLVLVDYPEKRSLFQIYNTFNNAVLKIIPELRGYSDPLTNSMIEFYTESKNKFTTESQAHYIYSPRELTRWVRGIYESIRPLEALNIEDLLRIWAHEALRLFQDRLVEQDEKNWTEELVDNTLARNFPMVETSVALQRPILFSNWLSKNYVSVKMDELRDYIYARLKTFHEEELDVKLVLFDSVLDHVLRIDRVFRQPQGHLLMIGISGSGKTTLTKFVAWINGLSIFQIKAHNKYTSLDFDEDLRIVLRRVGCKGEKLCFILDESNVMDSGFLERMNTLLANAEIPGLFEGDEYLTLMSQCKEGAQKQGLILDSEEELYKWFTQQIMKNLHVVFTMNPPDELSENKATKSPALFNRCVLNWVGDWSEQAFYQVGEEFTQPLDVESQDLVHPESFRLMYKLQEPLTYRKLLINAMVYVHYTIYQINNKLKRIYNKSYYNTPRSYLDFVNQFVKIFTEKRNNMEEQQRHLNIGLHKLNETVIEVDELRKSLSSKNIELESKNSEANQKLSKMVQNQQAAEKKKEESLKIQQQLEMKNKEIEERKVIVMEDLSKAEPAVVEAQKSVKNIKKQHLTEVRSMANPPLPVKIAMESVCILLGHKADSWKSVQTILRRDDFISSIENFDTKLKITKNIREKIKKDYMSNSSYNFETVNRASKACGPLVKWVIAQIEYSSILDKIGPLRKEVETLELSAKETQNLADNTNVMISELENSIEKYKQEYATLISEVQLIKTELEKVQEKVDRSVNLLANLSEEKNRWDESSLSFESQMKTIPGDVLLSAAYITYGGQYDQNIRTILLNKWKKHLDNSNIIYKAELSIIEYLSSQDERLSWEKSGLPKDDLLVENAIILKRFNRYPLIIDPSGQAAKFIENNFKSSKLIITSFLDNSINKNLESAIRFGNPIVIQDVERIDPVINPILNMELRRTGGRVLVRLGLQDIDYSPSFTLLLSTRDSSTGFSPDVCSRVTFVNFTVTKDSLQNQCLNAILKQEAPDVDKQRQELNKLQGEYLMRLRSLENSLLTSLSESQGNILDNDDIIKSLETIKTESKLISKKVEETEHIIKSINETVENFLPLSESCSKLFFLLDQMNNINSYYQFSLKYFYNIFIMVLNNLKNEEHYEGIKDRYEKLNLIKNKLFLKVLNETVVSLLEKDIPGFIILMCNLYLKNTTNELPHEEFEYFGENFKLYHRDKDYSTNFINLQTLDPKTFENMISLSNIEGFDNLLETANAYFSKDFQQNIQLVNKLGLDMIPNGFYETVHNSEVRNDFRKLILVKVLCPHKLFENVRIFSEKVFKTQHLEDKNYNFENLIAECTSYNVITMCSVSGYDASHKIDDVTKKGVAKHQTVAMGSNESRLDAEKALDHAIKYGGWVILKNVHLCSKWTSQLEKKLHNTEVHKSFKLFMTTDLSTKFPANLLLISKILIFEPSTGLKANLQTLISPLARTPSKGPVEQGRLYFLMAWLHGVIIERMRYIPLGWSKNYEFGESDFEYGLKVIDVWIEKVAKGRKNINIEKLPFDSIKTMLKHSVYGSKIDNENDMMILNLFVDHLFSINSFYPEYEIAATTKTGKANEDVFSISECTKLSDFLDTVNKRKPEGIDSPGYYGLPNNAGQILNNKLVDSMSRMLRKHSVLFLESESTKDNGNNKDQANPASEKAQLNRDIITNALKILPEYLFVKQDALEGIIKEVFDRELKIGKELLEKIRFELGTVMNVLDKKERSTNHSRYILGCISNGIIPEGWSTYYKYNKESMTLSKWISNLSQRLAKLAETIDGLSQGLNVDVWLGGLFLPESFLTATRQIVSRTNKLPLESLKPVFEFHYEKNESKTMNENFFFIHGIKLEGGCVVEKNEIQQDELFRTTNTGSVLLRWMISEEMAEDTHNGFCLPLYLNASRTEKIMDINMTSSSKERVIQYGVAFTAQ